MISQRARVIRNSSVRSVFKRYNLIYRFGRDGNHLQTIFFSQRPVIPISRLIAMKRALIEMTQALICGRDNYTISSGASENTVDKFERGILILKFIVMTNNGFVEIWF